MQAMNKAKNKIIYRSCNSRSVALFDCDTLRIIKYRKIVSYKKPVSCEAKLLLMQNESDLSSQIHLQSKNARDMSFPLT